MPELKPQLRADQSLYAAADAALYALRQDLVPGPARRRLPDGGRFRGCLLRYGGSTIAKASSLPDAAEPPTAWPTIWSPPPCREATKSVVAAKWAKRQRVRTTCRVVLNALADYADKAGRCWPSQTTLAAETGLAVRTIRLVLAELTAAGIIARTHRGNGMGGAATDLIVLHLEGDFDLVAVPADPVEAPEPPCPEVCELPQTMPLTPGRVTGKSRTG